MNAQLKYPMTRLEEEIAERRYLEEVFGVREKSWQTLVDNLHHCQLLTTILSASGDLVFMHDRDGRYIFASDPALRALGLERAAIEGKTWRELGLPAEAMGSFDAELESVFATGIASTNEIRFPSAKGIRDFETLLTPVCDANGVVTAVVSTVRDITERKAYQARLKYQANYDALTQLPNRHLLQDRLDHALAHAQRNAHMVAVLFLDLDRFKTVIDSLGHALGDILLQAVATRLKDSVREGDTVARLGGNEFVIVLEDLPRQDLADTVARKLREAINAPFQVEGHELFITAGIGISLFPQDGDDVHALLKNADAALHRTKEQGRNGIQFYTAELNTRARERLDLELALRHALDRDELELHYQPQMDLKTDQIIGAEALLRWRHPQWGMVPPARFVQIAEETGLIIPIGEWALRQACAQARAWQDSGFPGLRMAVNLSTRQFMQPGLIELITQVLQETGLEAGHLELEITESLLMQDAERAITLLHTLKVMGVSLSIDDFGTGYSSLNYLKRFPIDRLKIDKSFVQEITTNPEDAAITLAIISMAHSLKLKVIAEGVETEGQLAFLKSRHCDEMQGYYFSHPLPERQMTEFLGKRRALPLNSTEKGASAPSTLLLVDDDANVLLSLRRILAREGYQILTATNGHQGLELLARHQVGVVVADQLMPEMTGTDFLRRVRELYPDTLRIVLSGHSDMGTLIEAINEGAIYKFLAKPVPENTLRTTLRDAFLLYQTKTGRFTA